MKRPKIRPETRIRIKLRDGCRCRYCGIRRWPWWDNWQIDHIYPVAAGGRNRISFWQGNLALACADCNREKSDQLGYAPFPLTLFQLLVGAVLLILFDWRSLTDYLMEKLT